MNDPVDPTVPLLTGMLIGLVHGSGQDLLKVLRVTVSLERGGV